MNQHENFINTKPSKKNYDFIDSIRAIAMICIVAEHCFYLGNIYHPTNPHNFWIYSCMMQVTKLGTMTFFILAGFLIGDKFTDYTPGQYIKRRFANTVKPWLFWALFFVFLILLDNLIGSLRFHGTFKQDLPTLLPNTIETVFLFTNYWFIVNFLICITVLLIFKKYLYSLWFGVLLLALTFMYSFNIYALWFESRHTTALFGFVFFLWFGAQLYHRWNVVDNWIKRVPLSIFIVTTLATFILAVIEIQQLRALDSIDEFNTLRVSNVFYSISAFLLLLKIRHFPIVIKYLKPRETTFGIYLIHFILVYSFLPLLIRPLGFDYRTHPIEVIVLYEIIRFIIVYSITILLVSLINKTRFKWLIGR